MSRLERILGHRFRDLGLLETALSHRSYVKDNGNSHAVSNERLEFLGDSVLGTVVAEYFYRTCNKASEGELTRRKSAVVSRKALARKGKEIGLGDFVRYTVEAFPARSGRGKDTIVSNSLEAVIGAIYLDGGFGEAKKFIESQILAGSKSRPSFDHLQEAKNRLLHYTQVKFRCQPNYRIVETTGPEHNKRFHCEVLVSGKPVGRGSGSNKKEAEKQAAMDALANLPELNKE